MDRNPPKPDPEAADDYVHIEDPNPNVESLSESFVGVDDVRSEDDAVPRGGESEGLESLDRGRTLPEELSRNVAFLSCESSAEGGTCDVYVVGTAHVSQVASKLEVFPGAEFRVAFEEAMKYGGKVILGDRPVQLKEMDDVDMMTLVIQEMSKEFPTLMETLLHERDQYMSSTLLKIASEHSSVVAVVGKGHMNGIKKHWKQPVMVKDLLLIPSQKPTSFVKILTSVGVAAAGVAIVTGIYFGCKKEVHLLVQGPRKEPLDVGQGGGVVGEGGVRLEESSPLEDVRVVTEVERLALGSSPRWWCYHLETCTC
ncbi:hypothetical protein CDL15_Pgr002744 [Punica granatum]|uniref:TraB domain-containing protein-like n=1 Tax=Punica granatum TaxID=22663 RepID=A0A218X0P8_PUNGR|nr:hypothetical protein CDL15_Pgr002744 [Punica granatum]